MNLLRTKGLRRAVTVAGTVAATVLAMAIPAQAHEAVILDSSDVLPWKAPLILDGTDAAALLGTLPGPLTVRSAQLKMQAGEQLNISVTVANLAPENELANWQLPVALLVAPDGGVTVLNPTIRVPITIEGGLQLLLLRNYAATAISGTYSLLVSGAAAARFALSTGIEGNDLEEEGLARGSIATPEEVTAWYTTAP